MGGVNLFLVNFVTFLVIRGSGCGWLVGGLGLPLVGVQDVEVAQGGARQDVRGAVPGMGH